MEIQVTQELLDERGVKHVGNGGMTRFIGKDGCVCRAYSRPGHLTVDVAIMDASPEQAIAATLGGGRLTAEQVHELIAPHLHARPTFDFGHHGAVWEADFQAIADELNATLGRGRATQSSAIT